MGKLAGIGVIVIGVAGAFVALAIIFAMNNPTPVTAVGGSGVPGATIDAKYIGLTQEQITSVKIWKERCDTRAEVASYDSKTLGEVLAKKCVDGELSGIVQYREMNVRMNNTDVVN